jgi:DNA-binding SARP family transcriptional activator
MSPLLDSLAEADSQLHVRLLGGFRVERAGVKREVTEWPRRSAKVLTKLLATNRGHSLHREQIIGILWPDVDAESGLNNFGKALHAARHVLEPDLPPRQHSAYLRLADSMLVLDTKRVVVDADVFEQLAEDAIRTGEIATYQAALLAYNGELLPEDRYETWCAERRDALAETQLRLLVGLAEGYERRGAYQEAASRLRKVLSHDPLREAVHRQLMRLYALMGTPDQAVRQFHVCAEVLRQELDLAPRPETVSLYEAIRAGHPSPASGLGQAGDGVGAHCPATALPPSGRVFVGREQVLRTMSQHLVRRDEARAGMIVVSGEAGVGKTRLLEEFARRASGQGVATLRGGRGAHANQFACGPFAVALEDHMARLPAADRQQAARHYPALARFVPSLRARISLERQASELHDYHLDIIPSIVLFLEDLARQSPVLLVLGDLHEIDEVGLDLTRYLVHLAANMPLLMVGALPDPDTEVGAGSRQMIEAMSRERLWLRIELRCLSRSATANLVRALHPAVEVSDDTLAEIYEQTRGNPLLVREFAEGMCGDAEPGGAAPEPGRRGARAPAARRAYTALRPTLKDEALHQVLGLAASVDGSEVSLSQLRVGASALEPPLAVPVLFNALDRALRMHLLEERGGGYAFRYPVVRAALYDSLPRHRRDQFRAALAAPPACQARSTGLGRSTGCSLTPPADH